MMNMERYEPWGVPSEVWGAKIGSWMQVVREFLARLSLRYDKKFRKTTKKHGIPQLSTTIHNLFSLVLFGSHIVWTTYMSPFC